MIDAGRLSARMAVLSISQSELARRIGVSQQSISRLVSGEVRGSKHLHIIARELATTPAYLTGEIDDPDEGAPAPSPAPQVIHVMLPVALPAEAALMRMFQGLLGSLGDWAALPEAELARELATLLPTGLGQLRGPLRVEALTADGDLPLPGEAPASAARARRHA